MTNNYDKIAPHYDFLSRLVFFKAQVNAQINQLKYIPKNSNLLIVGGGTGWILTEIAKVHPAGLRIVYVEISAKMIEIARKATCGINEVEFMHSGIEDFQTAEKFDLILTPFLFDNFPEPKAIQVFQQLHLLLRTDGFWLFVDFTTNQKNGIWWKKLFLRLMYSFFRVLSNVEAKNLVDMNPYFSADYTLIDEQFYYHYFIRAAVYHKIK